MPYSTSQNNAIHLLISVSFTGNYNPSHGYQPIQYGCNDRPMSSGSSSSDVLTSKDISASQSDITSIIQQTNHSKYCKKNRKYTKKLQRQYFLFFSFPVTITNGSNKSSGSSRGGGGGTITNDQDVTGTGRYIMFSNI